MAEVTEMAQAHEGRRPLSVTGQNWGDLRERVQRVEMGLEQLSALISGQVSQMQTMDGKLDQVLETQARRAGAFSVFTAVFDGFAHAIWALFGALIILIAQYFFHR